MGFNSGFKGLNSCSILQFISICHSRTAQHTQSTTSLEGIGEWIDSFLFLSSALGAG